MFDFLKNWFGSKKPENKDVHHCDEVSAPPAPLDNGIELDTLPRKRNQINVIKPYLWEGLWVFDDPAVGLDKEALVAGMPEMILAACAAAGVTNPEKGFLALFSKDPFPSARICLQWVREESGGNVYMWGDTGLEGWLCPALFKYFDAAPEKMYVDVRSISNTDPI